jgi:hypothetical protein
MAALYPASLPTKSAAGATLSTNPHSSLHNQMYEEVVAIATELGVNPSGSETNVKNAIANGMETLSPANGTMTSYTSGTVQQNGSSISKTNTYSKYKVIDDICFWRFQYDMTAAGSAFPVKISLPVAHAGSPPVGSGTYGGLLVGGGGFVTAANAPRMVHFMLDSTTEILFWEATSVVSAVYSTALASGDKIFGSLFYRV